MNKKKVYMLFAFLMAVIVMKAQQREGTYAFLNSTNSARVAALGGTMIPIFDSDIQLDLFNPSLINKDIDNSVALSYVDYFRDINFATIQYGKSFEKLGNFVGTVQFHDYGKFYYADETGFVDGSAFSSSDYSINIGWGRSLNDRFNIGANIKFLGVQYENNSSFAIAVDVAGTFRTESDWIVSLVARNIGRELYSNYTGVNNKLPFKMQIGASKKLEHLPLRFIMVYDNLQKWNLAYEDPLDLEGNYDPMTGEYKEKSEMDKFAKNLFSHFVFAGELNIGKNLVLRLGYNYGYRQTMKSPTKKGAVGLSYGVGIRVYKFHISYSRSEKHLYGSPNYITITTNLNSFKKH